MRLPLLLPLAFACVPEAQYADRVGRLACVRAEVCAPDAASEAWEDRVACREALQESMKVVEDRAEGLDCPFVRERATACLDRLRSDDCGGYDLGEELTACGEAWACDD